MAASNFDRYSSVDCLQSKLNDVDSFREDRRQLPVGPLWTFHVLGLSGGLECG